MKSEKIFKTSIVIALVVPLIIGFIYYRGIRKVYLANKVSITKQADPEIVYNKKNKIDGIDGVAIVDSNYKNASHFDFNVTYSDPNFGNTEYDLYLKNVSFSENINPANLKWRLTEFNYEKNEYEVIFFGDFLKLEEGKINIGKDIPIGKDNFQKFRLYYYISFDSLDKQDYSDSKFSAELEIRWLVWQLFW